MKKYAKLLFPAVWMVLLCACGISGAYQQRLNTARNALEAGEYASAMAAYSEAVSIDAKRPDAYLGRGNVYAALAETSDPGSEERQISEQGALASYRQALESGGGAQARTILLNYLLMLGDEALQIPAGSPAAPEGETVPEGEGIPSEHDTETVPSESDGESIPAKSDGETVADESGGQPRPMYEWAESYYRSALELDISSVETRTRLADLLNTLARTEEALAVLETGLSYSHSTELTKRVEEIRLAMRQAETERRRASAADILAALPYYGSIGQCRMEVQQAAAYVQLIADGLSGKYRGYHGYGSPLYDYAVYWDEPYPVMGSGSYETDRALVWLGDLAGDGNPYLILTSSLVDHGSFEIYGWADGKASLVTGEECYGSRQNGVLLEQSDGTVILEESVRYREELRSGQTFKFRNGSGTVTQVWEEAYDQNSGLVHVTRNGITLDYSREEWQEQLNAAGNAGRLAAAASRACPLRDMASYLNAYAAALDGSENDADTESVGTESGAEPETNGFVPVELPPAHSPRHRMAAAMLHKLYELEHLAIDSDTRLRDLRILDLNHDGTEDLFAAFSGEYEAQNGTACQFVLYEWSNGILREVPGGAGLEELRLVQEKESGEMGVLGFNRTGTPNRFVYTFLSRSLELRHDTSTGRYEIVRDGASAGITASEYAAVRGRYEELEVLVNANSPLEFAGYSQAAASLYRIRDAA